MYCIVDNARFDLLKAFFYEAWETEVSYKWNTKKHEEDDFEIYFVAYCSAAFKQQDFQMGTVCTFLANLFWNRKG